MVLVIYGAGGLGSQIFDTVSLLKDSYWDRIVFIDDFNFNRQLYGVDVVSFPQIVDEVGIDNLKVIIGIGEPSDRAKLLSRITSEYCVDSDVLTSVIHPSAIISPSSSIGKGVYIGPFAFVSSNVVLDDNIVIQPHVSVGHDSQVGCSSVISPHAAIAGWCTIGKRTYIGLNSCVEQKKTIGDDVIIGMASCVASDIPSNVIALGYPARIVKNNEDKRVFV